MNYDLQFLSRTRQEEVARFDFDSQTKYSRQQRDTSLTNITRRISTGTGEREQSMSQARAVPKRAVRRDLRGVVPWYMFFARPCLPRTCL